MMKIVNKNTGWFPTIFDDLFLENRLDVPNYENFSTPKVNISENVANFVIAMAAPGLKKEIFAIEIEENTLKISANIADKKQTSTNKEMNFTRKEFNYNSFTRTFKLPETVRVEDINASYTDGILEITLPKLEDKKELKRMVEIS